MNSNQNNGNGGREMTDRAWPGAIEWRMGGAAEAKNEIVWRCESTRAGTLYNRVMFDTKAEAEEFVKRMQQSEPDQMFNVEAIKASTIWN